MELIISIIGFGNIGKTICSLLLPYKEYHFNINIVDNNLNVTGAILDLKHGAQLYDNHQISHNSDELLNNSDFIFHCAGATVPKGKSRHFTCQASADITEAVFKNFNPLKEPFIIVVSNPVDIITYITQKVTGLPKQNVIGTGTFLDSIRMNYLVKQTNVDLSLIDAIVLGEHGTSAFLSEQLSTVNSLPFNSIFNKAQIDELMTLVKTSAEKIKETQKATIFGVSYCALQIFESLISNSVQKLPVSTFIPEHLQLILGKTDVYLSLYSEISSKGAHPVKNYHPDKNEVERLKESIKSMKQSIPKKYCQ
jgi:L-lactate dehydrogenase